MTAMAGLGAASSLAGAFGGRSTYYRTQRKRMNRLFEQLYSLQAVAAEKSGAELRRTLESFQQSVKDARAENSGIFSQARREAVERGRQVGAQVNQGLISSGLSTTTVGANAQRGVGAETSRTLGRLSAEEAGRNQELIMGGAQGEAQLRTLLANLYQQQGQNRIGLGLEHGQMLFSDGSHQRGGSPAAAGMASFGSFLPFLIGGMGGGGGGGSSLAGWDPTAYRG
jgi:hypothetical protein